MIAILLRSLQEEAGISSDILCSPCQELTYVADCWFLGLHTFCAKHCIRIHAKADRVPSSAIQHDQFFLDIATSMNFKRQELVDIHIVCVYLQVCTISDIRLLSADHFISQHGKSSLSATAGVISRSSPKYSNVQSTRTLAQNTLSYYLS